jgi:UDP-N-acetylglucosamine/UDP-N-acetylgalactosamine diphosphorylase
VLPCLTNEGKILLASASAVAVAPDGNGGIYAALRSPLSPSTPSRTVLSDLDAHGITYLHAYCVDNCLVRVACPIFLGYCIDAKADCGAKVVVKTAPEEAVGVVALKGGKFGVVEYSEIPTDLSEARTSEGELVLRAANIANHFYTTKFLHSIASFESKMAHHIARKKIAHISLDEASLGQVIKPTKVNGMKLELFVFDVFPFVPTFALLEAERSTDFSPLKNAPGTGSDDPQTSRRDLLRESKRWLVDAGATVPDGVEIEVAAAVSYAGEGLESVKGLHFGKSGVVERVEDFQSLVV